MASGSKRKRSPDPTDGGRNEERAAKTVARQARLGLSRGARRAVLPTGLVAVAMTMSECACAAYGPAFDGGSTSFDAGTDAMYSDATLDVPATPDATSDADAAPDAEAGVPDAAQPDGASSEASSDSAATEAGDGAPDAGNDGD